ncbi:unnamed protein product [Paramecium octaurelia]|uniref:Calpain catalytic domain-containing protein n=1 Tax=Paramecium octaurelia TaxID=43137 RepID=A0A8S1TDU0_PAROT|nr:unnamed protein product [Paramecium octaurelia]
MYQTSQLINRRPNMRQLTGRARDIQEDDDDDFGISSFAKSKVDDDDEKFKNQNSDPDFLDSLLKKKSRNDSKIDKSNNSSIIPSTPPPQSTSKKSDQEISNTDPKKGQTQTQNNTGNKDTPQQQQQSKQSQQTPAKPNTTQPFQTPDPKQQQQQQKTPAQQQSQTKTPQAQPQPSQQSQTPQQQKTPQQSQTPQQTKTPQQTQTPQQTKTPQQQPSQTQTPVTNKTQQNQKQTPAPAPKEIVDPAQSIQNKPSAKKEDPKNQPPPPEQPSKVQPPPKVEQPSKTDSSNKGNQQPSQPQQQPQQNRIDQDDQEQQKGPQVSENRPTFVRRGKNTQIVKDVVKNIKTMPDDRIKALEPKNNIEVSKKLSLKFAPQKEYTDQTFPPNDLQVFQVFGHGQVDFKRFNLGRDQDTHQVVDPNDIVPGQQSSPLLQVLAAIAEQPQLITKILEDQVINEFGFYYARLCIGGVWKYILVDDLLGYFKGEPVGARTTIDNNKLKSLQKSNPGYQSEIWPFLIEKAFAKEYGSYEDASVNATVQDFLQETTGAPTTVEQISENVLKSLTQNDVALVHLPDGIFTFLNSDGKDVTLRNPWGWVKNQPSTSQPEGEFKIPIKSLIGKQITIAKFVPNNYHISYNLKANSDAYTSFHVDARSDTVATFRLHQRDERYFRNNISKKYDYCNARLLVFDEQQYLIAQDYGQYKTLSVNVNLQKGKYTVVILLDFLTEQLYDSTLTFYGTQPVEISRIDYRQQPNLLAQLYTKEAISKGQRKQNGQVEEFTYVSDNKLTILAWKYNGTQPNKWSKDLSKQQNRNTMRPITFVNVADLQQLKVLTTEQIKQLKLSSWQDASSFNIEFTQQNNTYAVVFK